MSSSGLGAISLAFSKTRPSPTLKKHEYLCPHLIDNVTARQVSHFVWVSNANIKCGLRSLLNAHTWLRLALRSLDIGGRLYRRRSSEAGAIFFKVYRVGKSSCSRDLGESRGWLRTSSGKRFLLRRGRGLLDGSRSYIGRRFSERTKRVEGIVYGFQSCRLCADFPCSSWRSSSGCPDFGASS